MEFTLRNTFRSVTRYTRGHSVNSRITFRYNVSWWLSLSREDDDITRLAIYCQPDIENVKKYVVICDLVAHIESTNPEMEDYRDETLKACFTSSEAKKFVIGGIYVLQEPYDNLLLPENGYLCKKNLTVSVDVTLISIEFGFTSLGLIKTEPQTDSVVDVTELNNDLYEECLGKEEIDSESCNCAAGCEHIAITIKEE